jgi:PAS domain S-box-containing protein
MKERKKTIILLRWAVIIVISYLILFGKGRVTNLGLGHLFILIYIISNLILVFFPQIWFLNSKLIYCLIALDTGIVSFGMYLSEKVTTDFYLVFFLIIIFASMSRNYKLLMVISGFTAIIYGVLLHSWGLLGSEFGVSYVLRIPFILIMAAFYGYIVQTFGKEKRQELALSEDKYRGLFENANDGIMMLKDSQFRIVDANREVEQLTGFKKEELLQRNFIELFLPAEKEEVLNYLKEILEKEGGRTDSYSFLGKDRRPLEVDLSIKRIDLGDASFYQVIFRDLTAQRKLEKKIRQSKMNLEAIFDAMQDHLSIQNTDYQILRVNRVVIEKQRKTFSELIGRKCYEAYHGRSLPCEKCPVSVTLETKRPAFSIMKPPESDTTFRIFSHPIVDHQGNLVSIIEHVQDITQEQQLQEQLIQSEKLAGLGILASGVAHEINNPLSGVIGMAEIALEEEDPLKKHDYIMDILKCSQRIKEIVGGLRSYSRAAKREELSFVDLNDILEESLKMVQLATKTHSVEVIKKFQPLEKIEINTGEIQQVFTNLVTNAFQAMNGRGGKLHLSTRSLRNSIEVKVGDNGKGIPEKYLKKIFDPFFTTKKQGEGTGLGLNIVYRIVTKYEGTIDVETKEGIGSTFTIRFPIRRIE